MKTISFIFENTLPKELKNLKGNILVQIYDGKHDLALTNELIRLLKEELDDPLIVGKSTKKAILDGTITSNLVCVVTAFDKTALKACKLADLTNFKGSLYKLLTKSTKAFLLLSNANLDYEMVLNDLKVFNSLEFFGSLSSLDDYLIYNGEIIKEGLILVSFDGEIEIHTKNILSFVGYGEYSPVTKIDNKRLYEINHQTITKYFMNLFDTDLENVKDIMLKFPFVSAKDEFNPLKITNIYEDGSVDLSRNLKENDLVRIAIPNFDLFNEDLANAFKEFSKLNVENVFTYSSVPSLDSMLDLNYELFNQISLNLVPINGDISKYSFTRLKDDLSLSTGVLTIVLMAEYENKNEVEYLPLKDKAYHSVEAKLCTRLLTNLAIKYNNLSNYVNNLTNNIEKEYKTNNSYFDTILDLPNYNALVKELLNHEEEYNLSICRFKNEYLLRDFYGDSFIDECKKEMAMQALNEYSDLKLYSINQGFATISKVTEKDHIKMMNEIYKKMFKYGYSFKGELIDFGFVYTSVYKGTKNALIKAKRALYESLENGYLTKDYRDTFSSAFELKEGLDHYSLVQNAYKNHGFKVYYQGIYSVKHQRINHFEALIRIKDNRNGKVYSPDAFIETAYKFGYSRFITMMVMEQAFEEVSKHSCAISLNLRLTDIEDNDVYYLLLELLEKYNCQNKVMLEILEDINIIKNPISLERLRDLREMGIKIAIDDFGAGYSNFDYLKPDLFDYLKISGELTKNLTLDNEVMIEMVKSVILTSHRLGMKVVVEYCEDEESADLLTELGADYIQGYYFAKPSETIEMD